MPDVATDPLGETFWKYFWTQHFEAKLKYLEENPDAFPDLLSLTYSPDPGVEDDA